ncbi:MAG TPA: hypothetical protein VMW24_12770 [Sedimentisphaerales bacterium]|nr:hypothetical protein [Sedimentisphaerales bacterium]
MKKISVEDKIQVKQLLYTGSVFGIRATNIGPSAVFSFGGMTSRSMSATVVSLTGWTRENGCDTSVSKGR